MARPKRMCGEITRKGTPCTRSASYIRSPGNGALCATHANSAYLRGETVEEMPVTEPTP